MQGRTTAEMVGTAAAVPPHKSGDPLGQRPVVLCNEPGCTRVCSRAAIRRASLRSAVAVPLMWLLGSVAAIATLIFAVTLPVAGLGTSPSELALRQGISRLRTPGDANLSGPQGLSAPSRTLPALTLTVEEAVLRSDTWGPGLITITGDVLINPGVVVTIAPGTTIQMATTDKANLGVDPKRIEVIVRGILKVEGPVIVTSLSSSPTCGDWYGFRFLPGSGGLLQDAVVEKAVHAVEINTTQQVTIADSTLRFNCHAPTSGDAWGAGLTVLAGTHFVVDTQIYGNSLQASGPQSKAIGAGVWLAAGSTLFEDSLVFENVARSTGNDAFGGGMALWGGGQPILRHCEIHHNEVAAARRALGGGIHIDNADVSIGVNSLVHDNTVTAEEGPAYGGGVAISSLERIPTLSIVDSKITANFCSAQSAAGCFGGGIGFASVPPNGGQTRAILSHNLIAANTNAGPTAYGGGIGMEASTSADRLDANIIQNNLAQATAGPACGGGICLASANSVHVTNNLVVDNHAGADAASSWSSLGQALHVQAQVRAGRVRSAGAPGRPQYSARGLASAQGAAALGGQGGGLYASGAASYLINNTIANNSAQDGGGIYFGNGIMYNNIVVSNQATHDGGGVYRLGGSAGYNDVWGNTPNGYAAGGLPRPGTDIVVKPRFIGSGGLADSYHLRRTSPCIDAGTGSLVGIPVNDFDRHPRPQGPAWDIGFDEVLGFELGKTASAAAITSGSVLTYTTVFTNWSTTTPLSGVWIRDVLPAQITGSRAPACNRPTCGRSDPTGTGGIVWWHGDVPANTSLTLVYSGIVEPGPPITNAAYYSVEVGLAPICGRSNVVTTTVNSPVLTLGKRTTPGGSLVAGAPFTYSIAVTNSSPLVAAAGVVVTDAIPSGARWVPAPLGWTSERGAGGSHENGIVTLTYPDIPPRGQARASWRVTTCRTSLENRWYRVITSTALVDSDWGPPLTTRLRAPKLVPSFAQSSDHVVVGETVAFTDHSTFEGEPIVAWNWDFDDGTKGSGTPVAHVYDTVASYTVTLAITDACGYSHSLRVPDAITVRPPPICTVVSGVDLTRTTADILYAGDMVQFSADISPEDAQKRYAFRLVVDGTLGFRLTSGKDPLTFSQVFATPGIHHVEIAVWNCTMAEQEAVTDMVEVRVAPKPSLYLPIVVRGSAYWDSTGTRAPPSGK